MVTHRLGNIAHAQNWPRTQAPRKRQRTCEQTWGLWKKVRACTCVCVCVCVSCQAWIGQCSCSRGTKSAAMRYIYSIKLCKVATRGCCGVFGSAASATKALPPATSAATLLCLTSFNLLHRVCVRARSGWCYVHSRPHVVAWLQARCCMIASPS